MMTSRRDDRPQTPPSVLLRRSALAALVVVLAVAGALLVRPGTADAPETATGDAEPDAAEVQTEERMAAPDVAFERFDGEPVRLDAWRGEPLVVNFWASWCPPCVAEMRDAFEPLHQDLGDRVTFLGVNLQDTEAAALDVVAETGVTYELARDTDGALFTEFGGFGMPLTALLDEDGTVLARHTGALTQAELEALVRDHLLEE